MIGFWPKSKLWVRTPRWLRDLYIRFNDPKRYQYKQRQIKVSAMVRRSFSANPGQLVFRKPDGTKVVFKTSK